MHVSGISFYQQQLPTITASNAAVEVCTSRLVQNVSPIARLRSLSSSSHLTLEDAVLLSTGEEKIGEGINSEFYHVNFTLLGCFDRIVM